MNDLDPDSLGPVLRRAAELSGRVEAADREVSLSWDDLAAAAAEAGIDPRAAVQAIAEARAGVGLAPASVGVLDRLIGPSDVVVVRVTARPANAVAPSMLDWLERGHHLRVVARSDGSIAAERRTDAAATMQRSLRSLRGEGRLGQVRRIEAGIAEAQECMAATVCVRAEVADRRVGAIVAGGGASVGSATAIAVVALVSSPFVLAAAPLAVGIGMVVSRRAHRKTVAEVTKEIERLVDSVASGIRPPSVLGVGQVLRRRPRNSEM